MRRVTLGATGIETSCLGFGCASLGSRIAPREGLRAVEAAFERGVSWLDLAPIYGGGAAETIVAPFLARHRAAVQICTKVGYAQPARSAGLKAAVAPLARRAVAVAPRQRRALRVSGVQAPRPLPLTPELLVGSLEASLRRLGTDHVDLYALHAADADEVGREPVRRALEGIVAAGKARAVAVASDAAAAEQALELGAPYGAVQFPLPEPGAPAGLPARAAAAGMGCITHSVFGVDGALARLRRRVAADGAARAEVLDRTGAATPEEALARLLLERAFVLNSRGVVLASMFSARSRDENLAVAAATPRLGAAELIDRLAA
jgi:aryl-alcohol dehydrogenase-like predicted oxidoreductase